MFYPEAIATIKASGVPWPIAVLHLRYGVDKEHTCGQCRLFHHGDYATGLEYNHCLLSWSKEEVPEETMACKKFQDKTPT